MAQDSQLRKSIIVNHDKNDSGNVAVQDSEDCDEDEDEEDMKDSVPVTTIKEAKIGISIEQASN